MRIVAGEFKGRRLAEPKDNRIRPTTDRTRESLFSMLAANWPEKLDGARVLDVFAGTGALGLEALSRGANFALFMENSVPGRGLLRTNIEALGLTGRTRVFKRDATKPGEVGTLEPFDLVFADPPYGRELGEKAIASLVDGGWLGTECLIVLEEQKNHLPENLPNLELIEKRVFGDTAIGFFERR